MHERQDIRWFMMDSVDLLKLLELLDCKSPTDCWLSDSCEINDSGIRAKPIDAHTEGLLIGDEWMVKREFEKDIQLDLPCTLERVVEWAEINGFSDVLESKPQQTSQLPVEPKLEAVKI